MDAAGTKWTSGMAIARKPRPVEIDDLGNREEVWRGVRWSPATSWHENAQEVGEIVGRVGGVTGDNSSGDG